MTCDQRETKYLLENSKVRNDGTELRKNIKSFQTYGTDVEGGVTLFMGIFQKADRLGGRLNQFKVFLCISHTGVFTSNFYIIQLTSTNGKST